MITTVTLNVSVDKAYYIKGIVVPGTVARVQKCVNSAGGKGLNVSRIIDFCGEEVLATGFAGGFNGAYVEDMLSHFLRIWCPLSHCSSTICALTSRHGDSTSEKACLNM